MRSLAVLFALGFSFAVAAQEAPAPAEAAVDNSREEFVSSLKFQEGSIKLPQAQATLNLPASFRYLDPKDAERVLSDFWGNPPNQETLGMLVPTAVSLADQERSWAIILQYENEGYVSDDDAQEIDYTDLLKDMQEGTEASNDEREEQGYGRIQLIGWAEPPRYDAAAHKLHWAKELSFNGEPEHTLNYDVRVLGRSGVLIMQAVANMKQLNDIKPGMNDALSAVEFDQGARYADFNQSTDKVAGYGLAALVAGGIAAKAGLFTKLFAVLLAFKKLAIGAVVLVFYGIKKLFTGKGKAES